MSRFCVGDYVQLWAGTRGTVIAIDAPRPGMPRSYTDRPWDHIARDDGERGAGISNSWVVEVDDPRVILLRPAKPLTEAERLAQLLAPRPIKRYGPYKPVVRKLP
jgi:hypothetical protein